MDFKLNGYIFEPEQTTILPNEFVKLHLSHLWAKNFRRIASYRNSFLYSIVEPMIKGLVWQQLVISALKSKFESETDI